MKKLLYIFAAAALTVLAAGCAKEMRTPAPSGDTVSATFTVGLPGTVASKAIADGESAVKLSYYVYDQNGTYLPNLLVNGDTEHVVTVTDKKATVVLDLVKGLKYSFVFIAYDGSVFTEGDDAVAYKYTPAAKTLDVDYAKASTNDEKFDLFTAAIVDKQVDGDFTEGVTLKRPFAQVNFGTTEADLSAAANSGIEIDDMLTKLTFTELGSQYNVLEETVSGTNATNVTVPAAIVPARNSEDLVVDGNNYEYVSTAYVLVPGDGKQTVDVDLDITLGGELSNIQRSVANVPVQKNYRTNIVGKIFTGTATFTITVDQNFNDAYTDDANQADYTPTYASIDDLNTAFAAGSLPYTVTLDTPEDGTIKLPDTSEDVSIRFMGNFSEKSITIQYADTPAAYPANLTLYAENLGTLNANLEHTHIELDGNSTISVKAVIGSNTSTFVMKPNSYVKEIEIIKGSLKIEAASEEGESNAYVEKVVIAATASDANTVIEGKVDVLEVHAGTVEIAETAEIEEQKIDPEVAVDAATTDGAALKAALESGSKEISVKLESDITDGKGIFIKANDEKNIVLDLNGHTIEFVGPAVGSTGTQSQALHLEKNNNITIKNGTLKLGAAASGIYMLIQNYCNLTLEDVTVDGTGMRSSDYTLSNNCGEVNLTGATSIIAPSGGYAFDACVTNYYPAGTKVTVNTTGAIKGKIEYGVWGSIPSPNLVALTIEAADLADAQLVIDSKLAAEAADHICISDAVTIPENKGFEDYVFTSVATKDEYMTAMNADKQIINVRLTANIPDAAGFFLAANQNKKVTLDLNGKTLTVVGPAVGSTNTQSQAFHLEKGNTVIIKNGTATVSSNATNVQMYFQNYCDLTLKDLFVDTSTRYAISYLMSNNCGKVNIIGNTTLKPYSTRYAFDACVTNYYPDGTQIIVNTTGTISGKVQYDIWGSQPAENKVTLDIYNGNFTGALVMDNPLAEDAANHIKVHGGTFTSNTWDAYKVN